MDGIFIDAILEWQPGHRKKKPSLTRRKSQNFGLGTVTPTEVYNCDEHEQVTSHWIYNFICLPTLHFQTSCQLTLVTWERCCLPTKQDKSSNHHDSICSKQSTYIFFAVLTGRNMNPFFLSLSYQSFWCLQTFHQWWFWHIVDLMGVSGYFEYSTILKKIVGHRDLCVVEILDQRSRDLAFYRDPQMYLRNEDM